MKKTKQASINAALNPQIWGKEKEQQHPQPW